MTITTVRMIPENADFVSDSQDVQAIREHIGKAADGYDSFFVILGEGDYAHVWGIAGIVPHLSKLANKLI